VIHDGETLGSFRASESIKNVGTLHDNISPKYYSRLGSEINPVIP